MRVAAHVLSQLLGEEYVVLGANDPAQPGLAYHLVEATSVFLWRRMLDGEPWPVILAAFLTRFDVDADRGRREAEAFRRQLAVAGLVVLDAAVDGPLADELTSPLTGGIA